MPFEAPVTIITFDMSVQKRNNCEAIYISLLSMAQSVILPL